VAEEIVKSTGCCEPFDSTLWDNKEVVWKDKPFVTDQIVNIFHIPLNMGNKVVKNMGLIENAGAKGEQLMLVEEKSPWKTSIYIDVAKNVPSANMAYLSGTFLTKVFEGPYRNTGMWAKEMKEYVKTKGRKIVKLYFSFTTCPHCAKVYGKNYVILFAQTD